MAESVFYAPVQPCRPEFYSILDNTAVVFYAAAVGVLTYLASTSIALGVCDRERRHHIHLIIHHGPQERERQMTRVVDGRESGVTMEEGWAGRRRQFVTLWKKAAQGGGCSGWSSDATALFPSPPRKSPSLSLPSTNGSRSRTKDCLARLIAMDMQAGAASSSISLSPRILSYCYTRWVQCSRRTKSQEEEVALCEHASFYIPTELRVRCWVLI